MSAAGSVLSSALRPVFSSRSTRDRAGPRAIWPWLWSLTALAFSMVAGPVRADDTGALPTLDSATLLTKIQQAAQRQNYVGTFVHQQGTQVQSSRVTHVLDRSGEHEKLEMMDGQSREFIRHNEDVRCYVPDSRLIVIEKRARYDSFPALLTSAPVDLDSYYRMSVEGVERIAGHSAQAVSLEARDKQRYGYRFWYDRDSFLLLKAQTIGDKGAAIEQVAFTDVAIGGPIDSAKIRPTANDTGSWRVETNRMVPVDLADAGWTVTRPVPGFHKVMEVRRAVGGREDIGQMVFSDGLAAISVFIEPASPRDAPEGEASRGPVNVVSERHGDFWLTVVGDTPAASVRDMARQVAFRSGK